MTLIASAQNAWTWVTTHLRLIGITLASLLLLWMGCHLGYSWTPRLFSGSHDLTDENFDTQIANNGDISLVKMHASWCGHCQKMKPDIAAANDTLWWKGLPSIKSLMVSTNQGPLNQESVGKLGGVKSFPTILAVDKDGEVIGEYQGRRGAADLADAVEKINECVPHRGTKQYEYFGWFTRSPYWDYNGNTELKNKCEGKTHGRTEALARIIQPGRWFGEATHLATYGPWILGCSLCGGLYWKWESIRSWFGTVGEPANCEEGCCDHDDHAIPTKPPTLQKDSNTVKRKDPKSKGSPGKSTAKTIFLILGIVCALGMLGLGFWYFKRKSANEEKDVFAQLEDIRQQREGEENLDDAPQETPEEPEKTEGEILCETITTETDLYE